MRERLLAAVRARTAQTIETGDPRSVLAPDAVAEADALLARVSGPAADPGELDLEALHAVGWLYWLRVQALPVGEWDTDMRMAVLVLEPVYAADPRAVPDLLRDFYDQQVPPPGDRGRGRAAESADPAGPADPADPADPAACTEQGGDLYDRYLDNGDIDALQRAVRWFRAALAAVPDGHPNRGMCLFNLHTAVSALAEETGDADDLREAVTLGRALLQVTADGDPERAGILSGVSSMQQLLFEHTGDMDALRGTVETARVAVAATPEDDPRRAGRLSNLGTRLEMLFQHTGDEQTLHEAVAAGRAAVAAVAADAPERATCLSNLGASLRLSFGRTGDLATLHEAVALGRAAVAATADGDPGRAGRLSSLGGALQVLYEHTGDVGALREAVTAGRAAAAAAPSGHPHHALCRVNVGVSLRELFERTGDLDLLREAVTAHREAMAATAAGHPNRAGRLTNLGNTLRVAYDRIGDPDLLREAVDAARAAVAATPADHPLHAGYQSNLGLGLHVLFDVTNDQDVLRGAVAAARAALAATPADHPLHARYQSNLGLGLQLLSERTGDPGALREAVAAGRAALAATPDGHADLARYLSGLGAALHDAFERTGDRQALQEARTALARAAGLPTAAVTERITAGKRRARVDALAGDHRSALAAMETVVTLLPQVASRELRRSDRAHRLGEVAGLGAGAAAAALGAGQPGRAVELLERARGLLLAETMGARTDQARLRERAPDLADEFTRLRDHLADLESPSSGTSGPVGDPPDADRVRGLADQRRAAAAEWDRLLERIRARPGLADFLTPPAIDRLRLQAEAGPIVIVSADASRCDALILTAEADHPARHVPLTGLTMVAAYEQAARFLAARRTASTAPDRTERRDAQAVLREILAWLWDAITEPVLADLGYTGPPESGRPWPRLWWCPVGGMSFLPLHAAGHHQDIAAGVRQPRTVLDRVVSSYTATIQALAYARRAPTPTDPAAKRGPALIVAMPDTPDATPLPGVTAETERLTSLLPGATVLRGERATYDAVVAALPDHPVAHFACHGISDWAAPDTSRLLLHDHSSHPFTVGAVSRLHLAGADLAYLSACSTTDTHPELADEAVHITAAFQLAGYRNVIGTLWPVGDRAAGRIAVDVYTRLTDDGANPPDTDRTALALHHAVRALRTDHPATPTHWAAHIHTGV